MTTPTAAPPTFAPSPTPDSGSRAAKAVAAILAALAFAALAGGITLGVVHTTQRDDGYYTSDAETLTTPTRALVTDGLDIDADGAEGLVSDSLGTIRVTATATAGKPVFVGIARAAQVDAYLEGAAREDITDVEVDPFSVTTSRRGGDAKPGAPTRETFWAKSASGGGTQTLEWRVRDGAWDVVAMNADGSRGIRTDVAVAARFPVIGWIAIGLLVLGSLLAVAAAAVFAAGRRRR